MEYGYEITDTAGNKHFFIEGCTYCSISTGGLHEIRCPLYQYPNRVEYQASLVIERIKDEHRNTTT